MNPLKKFSIGPWLVHVDVVSTEKAYEQRVAGAAEECGCLYCRNYAAARSQFPREANEILRGLGINPALEAQVSHASELPGGLHLYSGFFHLVGKILSGQDVKVPVAENVRTFQFEPVCERFSLGFTAAAQLVSDSFKGQDLVQLEYAVQLPWVLSEPPDL